MTQDGSPQCLSADLRPGPAASDSRVWGWKHNRVEDPGSSCLCLHSAFFPQDLAKAFQEEAQASGKERLLLSAAVPAGRGHVDAGYEVDKIAL